MAWQISDLFPTWGDAGERPSDNFEYAGGDQVNEKHFDYLWFNVGQLEQEVRDALSDLDSDGDGTVDSAENVESTYKGNDIDSDGDGTVDSADDATNVSSTYKGNDIDSDGDGTVDQADDALSYKGNDIDSDGDGVVDVADDINGAISDTENVTQTYKGNDIDSNADGIVDEADLVNGKSLASYEYTSPGTYNITVPSDAQWVWVYLVGGGGSGSGYNNQTDWYTAGGGGGAMVMGKVLCRHIGSTVELVVGDGGDSVDIYTGTGRNGGDSTFWANGDQPLIAQGGGGGAGDDDTTASGGSGGTHEYGFFGGGRNGNGGQDDYNDSEQPWGGDAAQSYEGVGGTDYGADGEYPGGGGAGTGEHDNPDLANTSGAGADGYANVVFL